MQSIIAIACIFLLTWIGSAGAQDGGAAKKQSLKVYPVSVSVHKDLRRELDRKAVKDILARASELLKHCRVGFKLEGPIKTFRSPSTPPVVTSEAERDALHHLDGDVKVVEHIKFCREDLGNFFNGCAFPPAPHSKSIIVTHKRAKTTPLRAILWAHEFGHRTGLTHRPEQNALMTGCRNLFGDQIQVSEDECECFRAGPGGCTRPELPPALQCSTN